MQHSELSCNTSQTLQVTEMSQTDVVLTAGLALGDKYGHKSSPALSWGVFQTGRAEVMYV